MKKKGFIFWLDDEKCIPLELSTKYQKIYTIISIKHFKDIIGWLDFLSDKSVETYIFFDHDLGEKKTGYDVAKWIVERQYPLTAFEIHSQNPVGVKNIRDLLTYYGYKEFSWR